MASMLTEAKLQEWMERLGPRLITVSAAICRDHHRAEEIVQEAFVKLWRKPPEVGEVAYASWLRRVVTNLSINALKRTPRPAALPEFSIDPAMRSEDRPEDRSEQDEAVSLVFQAMDRLDDAKRSILVLRAYEGLSYEEIAEHLGVPVGTVMSRLNRARKALLDEMDALRGNTRDDSNDRRKSVEDEETDDGGPLTFQFRRYKLA
jgi:RNA polymerase sigma-70 factor (ECF subfamily)